MDETTTGPAHAGQPRIGHWRSGDGFFFRVWAPRVRRMELELVDGQAETLAMDPLEHGYWEVQVPSLSPGSLYRYRLNRRNRRPDPASHHQPQDVHGPSATVDHQAFGWTDHGFTAPGLADLILYELHVGAFTRQGTFDAAASRLDELARLGVTAIQLMPVAQFPGSRNWGYDGAYPYAVQTSYGGPLGLKRLVDACHGAGLAVFLDVVYNHLGPEGNYSSEFGPYYTARCTTPWGDAVNFDGPGSDHVRAFFVQNALHWAENYHLDGLRLDATHTIMDTRPRHLLEELAAAVRELGAAKGRQVLVIAEDDLNDPRLATPVAQGGYGLSAIYSEDFHHAIHARLTGERRSYYQDFGTVAQAAKALGAGYVYTGEYSAYRDRGHGRDPGHLPARAIGVFIQNHDQIGNRAHGDRLSTLVPFEALKLAAAMMLLSPFTPMLFMGEEYGEERPFLYFTSHLDPKLAEAVRTGRKAEFSGFHGLGPEAPDPQDEKTFNRSKLQWERRGLGSHGQLLAFYRELIRLRKTRLRPAGADRQRLAVRAAGSGDGLLVAAAPGRAGMLCAFNLSGDDLPIALHRRQGGAWDKVIDSADGRWGGPGSAMPTRLPAQAMMRAWSAAVYCPREPG